MSAELKRRPEKGPSLEVIDGGLGDPARDRAEVVAEVLSDGTIRALGVPDEAREDFTAGHLTGPGWTIWWDRRRW